MDAPEKDFQAPAGTATWRHGEFLVFAIVLVAFELAYFGDALRPGWVLSAADWLLSTEAYRDVGGPDYDPANRLLSDIATQNEPWMRLAADEWRAGRVPLWNPYAGCGAPLLANAQSGVFFPLYFIYFLTRAPSAWVVIAIAKLWLAGAGTFLFARSIGLGRWGRWFAGLSFPFSGFLIVWLQYALASVAAFLPLVLWRVEKLLERPSAGSAGGVAALVALVLLAGHPETAAHVLLVAAAWAGWRLWTRPSLAPAAWFTTAVAVGVLTAAVQLVPLAEYLAHSQVWLERSRKLASPLELVRPDLAAMPAVAFPYYLGSYRRGHPHVEKALGVDNFNEIAGGYTGLVTLAVLVPLALAMRRRHPWVLFWIVLDLVAIAIVYRLPVADNLIRVVPILRVAHNQRLLLAVALAHCLLGGVGLESWPAWSVERGALRWALASVLGAAAVLLVACAILVRSFAPAIHERARSSYAVEARARNLAAEALDERADRQAQRAVDFFPRYYLSLSLVAGLLAAVVLCAAKVPQRAAPYGLLGLALADLFAFGRNYNPAIPAEHYFPRCSIIQFLQRQSGPFRVLPLEEEFPPNVLGVYGIADARNYDSIELRTGLEFFRPLWEGPGRLTSNAWTSWDRLEAHADLLRVANIRYLISTREPPSEMQGISLVHQSGRVRVYELAPFAEPARETSRDNRPRWFAYGAGEMDAEFVVGTAGGDLIVPESWMPGWIARVEDRPVPVHRAATAWIGVPVEPGSHRVQLSYRPRSFLLGAAFSAVGLIALVAMLSVGMLRAK